ncbi:MAG: RlmE family RNA methyltransferase [Alphaproteobacteria bacterium]|nr:RlmE family RNA methyltransferase [Alphaproteobacteria bacterium]
MARKGSWPSGGRMGAGAKGGRGGISPRGEAVRVKTAGGRKASSTQWLQRQLNDPYVREAKRLGYRSRAAFKLAELDDRFRVLKPGARVVDLGAAPGGWTQVAVERTGSARGKGFVLGVDVLDAAPIADATLLRADFTAPETPARIKAALGGQADVVLSDMAAPATGHGATDHVKIVALAEAAYDFAVEVLASGGAFVCKVYQGGAEGELLQRLKRDFAQVRHAKPPASRSESAEVYLVAQGFRGPAA